MRKAQPDKSSTPRIDGWVNKSMNISNQKALLRGFAEKNGMLNYEYYVDML